MVWVFQSGHGAGLLHFTATGTLDTTTPILMFCIAFGLSMDYEVFLLSRIKEEHDRGASTEASVAIGLERTGRIVTAAAALLAIVFISFATSSVTFIKLFGLGPHPGRPHGRHPDPGHPGAGVHAAHGRRRQLVGTGAVAPHLRTLGNLGA